MQRATPSAALGDRSLFPTLAYDAYLNHAGISPPSSHVLQQVQDAVADYATRAFAAWPTYNERRSKLRDRLATLIGAQAQDIGFTTNTSSGVMDVALCFPWKSSDTVVVFDGEFPANVTAWQMAARTFGLEVRRCSLEGFARDPSEGLAALEALLRDGRVALVAVSAVQFQTGLRMPIAAIGALAHRYGAQLFVDAVQACGAVPVDVREGAVDYLACGAHKWLMGTEGAGFLYVRRERIEALVPRVAGWLSHEEGVRFLLEGPGLLRYDRPVRARTDFIEAGNLPTPSFAALDASLALIEQIGVEAIFAHVQGYLDALEPALVDRGFRSARTRFQEGRSGSLCLLPPEGVALEPLHRALVRERIGCAMPDGYLRFSPHWPNATSEIDGVLRAVDRAIASVR